MVTTSVCHAGDNGLQEILSSILASKSDSALPTTAQFFSEVNENTAAALAASDVQDTFATIRQCLESPRLEVRRYGLITVMALSFRPDSSALLEPVIDDIERIANETGSGLRHAALSVLGSTKPNPRPKPPRILRDAWKRRLILLRTCRQSPYA